jgi:calcineurin-like phosphoesterase family protein
MHNVFFTGDTHYSHSNIIKYCNRPFKDSKEMNERLVSNYNEVVKDNDVVYHLGDVMFGQNHYLLTQLRGKKILLIGNHDHGYLKALSEFFVEQHYLLMIRNLSESKRDFVLCHYPIESWPSMNHSSIHIHGHCHGNLPSTRLLNNRFDVGVDAWPGYRPVHLDEILSRAEKTKKRQRPLLGEDEK